MGNGKPLVIDGFAGLGGWAEGFLAENYDVVGFDIERHDYGTGGYPGQLVLQDWLTLDGAQFKHAACIVASPPCTEYSYMAMPWSRGKQIAAALRGDVSESDGVPVPFPEEYKGSRTIDELNALFNSCFRIQREAIAASGRHIPLVVENVKGAQPWVGPAKAHYGSFYLWGDVASVGGAIVGTQLRFGELLRVARHRKVAGFNFHQHESGAPGGSFQSAAVASIKNGGGSWFAIGSPGQTNVGQNPDGRKVPGLDWSGSDKPGYVARAFNDTAVARLRSEGGKHVVHDPDAVGWFGKYKSGNDPMRNTPSHSKARKAASAQIAKIPFPLSNWIAKTYKPGPLNGTASTAPDHAGGNGNSLPSEVQR